MSEKVEIVKHICEAATVIAIFYFLYQCAVHVR